MKVLHILNSLKGIRGRGDAGKRRCAVLGASTGLMRKFFPWVETTGPA